MADSIIQIQPNSTGEKIDTEEITVGANSVHRERDQIAGAAALEIAAVKNADPALTLYGLIVRAINTGNVAHGGADAGAPTKMGYKALATGANPTAVDVSDRVDAYASTAGMPFMVAGHPNTLTFRKSYTAAQTNAILVSVGAGSKIVVTAIKANLNHDAANAVSLRAGPGATTPTDAKVVLSHPGLPAGATEQSGNGSGMLVIGGDGEDLLFDCDDPLGQGATIEVSGSYFTVND